MSTTRNTDTVEVIMRDQRLRRWSLAEKASLVRRSYEPGMSVSLVVWRKLERQGALTAVSAGEATNEKTNGLLRQYFLMRALDRQAAVQPLPPPDGGRDTQWVLITIQN